jgi:hypothetical protein
VVPDIAGGVSEDKVMDKCFELVFAFDEVITTGGYRESITLPMIKTHVVRLTKPPVPKTHVERLISNDPSKRAGPVGVG